MSKSENYEQDLDKTAEAIYQIASDHEKNPPTKELAIYCIKGALKMRDGSHEMEVEELKKDYDKIVDQQHDAHIRFNDQRKEMMRLKRLLRRCITQFEDGTPEELEQLCKEIHQLLNPKD